MSSTLITNARMVNEGRTFDGDLRIENGRIAQIGSGLAPRDGEQVVDAAGRWLLPGMIDDQVHFREPGLTHKGDIASESAAAVAGGLTSFMDMPNTNPPTLDSTILEAKYELARGRAWANYGFYHGASNAQPRRDPCPGSEEGPGREGVHGCFDRQHAGGQPGNAGCDLPRMPDPDHHALRRHADDRCQPEGLPGKVRRCADP